MSKSVAKVRLHNPRDGRMARRQVFPVTTKVNGTRYTLNFEFAPPELTSVELGELLAEFNRLAMEDLRNRGLPTKRDLSALDNGGAVELSDPWEPDGKGGWQLTLKARRKRVRTAGKRKVRAVSKTKQKTVHRYVRIGTIPKTVPAGLMLVHNHIQHDADTPAGLNGFRAWLSTPEPQYVACDCGWAADVPGGHYRVDFSRIRADA